MRPDSVDIVLPVYHGNINILENNPWGYAFSCFLFPALLQGDKAVDSITGQLRAISRVAEHFDAIVIIRGGGGEVGLNCYDSYLLAKEVAMCPLPVITGIGHSTNETVVEMVAGHNKITPTDVAYFLIQYFHNFSSRLEESKSKINKLSGEVLEEEKRKWEEITKRLRFKPGILIREKQIALKNRTDWFNMRVGQVLNQQKIDLGSLEQKVQLLNPQNVLKRGYSITYHNGKSVTDIIAIKTGDTIVTRLYKGNIYSEIKSKKK